MAGKDGMVGSGVAALLYSFSICSAGRCLWTDSTRPRLDWTPRNMVSNQPTGLPGLDTSSVQNAGPTSAKTNKWAALAKPDGVFPGVKRHVIRQEEKIDTSGQGEYSEGFFEP